MTELMFLWILTGFISWMILGYVWWYKVSKRFPDQSQSTFYKEMEHENVMFTALFVLCVLSGFVMIGALPIVIFSMFFFLKD